MVYIPAYRLAVFRPKKSQRSVCVRRQRKTNVSAGRQPGTGASLILRRVSFYSIQSPTDGVGLPPVGRAMGFSQCTHAHGDINPTFSDTVFH